MNIYFLPFLIFSWVTSSFCMEQAVLVATDDTNTKFVRYPVQSPILLSTIKERFEVPKEFNDGIPTIPCTENELQTLDTVLSTNQEILNQEDVETLLNCFIHLDYLSFDETEVERKLLELIKKTNETNGQLLYNAYQNVAKEDKKKDGRLRELLADPLGKIYSNNIDNIASGALRRSKIEDNSYHAVLFKNLGIPWKIFLSLVKYSDEFIEHFFPDCSSLRVGKNGVPFFVSNLIFSTLILSPLFTKYQSPFRISATSVIGFIFSAVVLNSLVFLNKKLFLGTRIPRNLLPALATTLFYQLARFVITKQFTNDALYQEVPVQQIPEPQLVQGDVETNEAFAERTNLQNQRANHHLYEKQNIVSFTDMHINSPNVQYKMYDRSTDKTFILPNKTVVCAKISDTVYVLGEIIPSGQIISLSLGQKVDNSIVFPEGQPKLWEPVHSDISYITAPIIRLATNFNTPITSVKIEQNTDTRQLRLKAETGYESFIFPLTPDFDKFNPFIKSNVKLHQNIQDIRGWISFGAFWLTCHYFSKDRAKQLLANLQQRLNTAVATAKLKIS